MTNLVTFQRGYQASARMMTTIDSMLDTLINHTGTVGL
jgi:flagellar hook-associated protein 1 FlgK